MEQRQAGRLSRPPVGVDQPSYKKDFGAVIALLEQALAKRRLP